MLVRVPARVGIRVYIISVRVECALIFMRKKKKEKGRTSGGMVGCGVVGGECGVAGRGDATRISVTFSKDMVRKERKKERKKKKRIDCVC